VSFEFLPRRILDCYWCPLQIFCHDQAVRLDGWIKEDSTVGTRESFSRRHRQQAPRIGESKILLTNGTTIASVCKQIGVADQAFCKWCRECDGLKSGPQNSSTRTRDFRRNGCRRTTARTTRLAISLLIRKFFASSIGRNGTPESSCKTAPIEFARSAPTLSTNTFRKSMPENTICIQNTSSAQKKTPAEERLGPLNLFRSHLLETSKRT